MARLSDLPATKAREMETWSTPVFDTAPWVSGPPLARRTVAIVSTAGLINRGDRPVTPHDTRYRVIPRDSPDQDVLMSHASVNFDRTGFQQDLNVVLPRARLRELADDGVIGAAADNHYAFMGATDAHLLEPSARKLAGVLHHQGVDTALLLPV